MYSLQAQLGAPCLRFDVVKDILGDERTDVRILIVYCITYNCFISVPHDVILDSWFAVSNW